MTVAFPFIMWSIVQKLPTLLHQIISESQIIFKPLGGIS
jgi:hypothetical protein